MPLRCSQLSVNYGRRKALNGFRLSVQKGEIRALIGPNGSGKSTALQAMAGLIQPAEGQAEIGDVPVTSMARRTIAKKLAFLPQQPSAPDEMTIAQLVRQGRFPHVGLFRSYDREDEAAIEWALESTGLTSLADRTLQELSGGERQRAWISAALAQEAGILLLDEPTSFLDIGYQVEVLDLVHRLSREKGVTIVMAIHDINQAIAVSDRISLLEQGELRFDGEPRALADSGLIEKTFRVKGRFVEVAAGKPPHFDIELTRFLRSGA
ncbi:ABC transporter ATP-binding protein [Sinorhizobium meliloti]|uniref:ABC transporter ATP-binding protein n=1 Tax=Rhizobium meliloti TaxID=382 RepID=UPI000FDBEBBC|nr:ABC transporter ATP-binding protein [Sinorhizobium meliloti]MDW9374175.1 ATP-binding cassette domain-containing protein [Sinorhizobium meliloti]MDW9462202.1 ATP-binding cassette domain-containing protein [Sinorhizobium meliloti]MDW9492496.1 ATP-binding cassette domain-containing protein [Sinorhizobium meliloti]MDW9560980.1 ATP-binding cassette domain-containing protein [Sinorhizobium meliloti]MDW9648211.1 ATP-binding cassette domain-containing protein [Sinorhizobium meliloti]